MDKEKLIMEKVGCPCKVFENTSNLQEEVSKAYFEALERGKKEGFTPVILAFDEDIEDGLSMLMGGEDYSKEEELAKKLNDAKEILKERLQDYIENYTEDECGDWIENMSNCNWKENLEGFENEFENSINEFSAFADKKEVILFEVPTKNAWEVIAWFPMGGWNECPWVDDMMAVSHYWYEKYHAMPAVITTDVLEYFVENPVDNEEDAFELAKEHYAFCPDRVDQGTASGTLNEVADCLINSKVWYFWWD